MILDRLRTVAGVRSAALSNLPLLSASVSSTSIFVSGRTYPPGRHDSINRLVVSSSFFDTMEMPIRAGRGFTGRDSETAPKVAVINETAARQYFANENPIGKREGSSIETAGQIEIVGIVRDAKYDSVRDPVPPTVYIPFLQRSMPSATMPSAAETATAIANRNRARGGGVRLGGRGQPGHGRR